MKKIIALLVATCAVNALADHHMRKLVTFDSHDLQHVANLVMGESEPSNGGTATETDELNLNVNMSWEVRKNLWVGGILGYNTKEVTTGSTTSTDTVATTYGLRVVYDFMHKESSNLYAEFRYLMSSSENKLTSTDTDSTEMRLGIGYRCQMFKLLAGPHVNFSPSIEYSTGDWEQGTTERDTKETRINLVKFDVIW